MKNEETLFKVEVNDKGAHSIRRIYRIVSVCFWMGIMINLVMMYFPVHSYFKYINVLKTFYSGNALKLLILIFYMLLFSIAYFLQFFYFLKFAGQAKKSIQINDSFPVVLRMSNK